MKRIITIALVALCVTLSAVAQKRETFADRITFGGYGMMSADLATPEKGNTTSSFFIPRLELLGMADITDKWKVAVTLQFNGHVMLKDMYMQYTFMPELKVKMGQFKTPFAHENQVAPFLNPTAAGGSNPTVYFAGIGMDPLYSGTSGRDIGIDLSGDLWDRVVSYRLMMLNGRGMNTRDIKLGKTFAGSIYVRPLQGIALHTSYMGGKQIAMGAAKGIDAGSLFTRHRVSAGVTADYEPISVMAEYMYGKDNSVAGMGAYLTATVHLPKRYDVVLSGDYLKTDMSLKDAALYSATLGVNKWFYGNCRAQLFYTYTLPAEGMHLGQKGHLLRAQLQFAF